MLPFEESYQTKRWDLCQFGFIVALAMTNAQLGYNYFVRHKNGEEMLSKAEFVRELAREFVQNPDGNEANNSGTGTNPNDVSAQLPVGCSLITKRSVFARAGHELCRLEPYRGRWNGREFPKIKTEYSKLKCSWGCGTLIRTFCRCDCSLMLCTHCYGEHIVSVNCTNSSN